MKKTDLVKRIHQQAELSEKEAATVFEGVLEILVSTLQKGEPIAIQEFGKFAVRNKLARLGRNPRTGEPIMISARRVVTFRASSHFNDEVNIGSGRRAHRRARG